jgi:hypothetical protein
VSDLAAFYVMAAQNSASLVAEMVGLMASQVGQPVNAKVENQK